MNKQFQPSAIKPCVHVALREWSQLIQNGRVQIEQADWNAAAITYGNAFEQVEALFSTNPNREYAIESYIRTAVEFAYSLRKSTYTCDLSALLGIVKYRLEQEPCIASLDELLLPLRDISFAPVSEIDRWVQILFAMDAAKLHTKH